MFINTVYIVLELLILLSLVIEDEKYMEISVYKLICFLFLQLSKIYYTDRSVNLSVVLWSSCIFILIFVLTGGIGFGDVVLCSILAMNYKDIYSFHIFFTITFAIGSIYSIYLILYKNYSRSDPVPFVKFIVCGYYISYLLELL